MAIADVYDAFISRQVYKPPYTHEQAVEFIKTGRGSHFDPEMTDAFKAIADQFKRAAEQFAD